MLFLHAWGETWIFGGGGGTLLLYPGPAPITERDPLPKIQAVVTGKVNTAHIVRMYVCVYPIPPASKIT